MSEQVVDKEQEILEEKIKQYDPLIQRGFQLLKDVNRHSLIHVLEYCGIPKDVKVSVAHDMAEWSSLTNKNTKFWLVMSKGNLKAVQGAWHQLTGPLASNTKIFKDADTMEQNVLLVLDYIVPLSILRTLHLNAKKVQPLIQTLYGYEPYNILDMSSEDYAREKLLADAQAIEYSEKYKEHINFLLSKSPYEAANCILALQGRLNLKVQSTIQEVLLRGNTLTMDNLIVHSFEPMAEATRELLVKYNAEGTTDEDKAKIRRYFALYFAKIEEVNTKTNTYIESLKTKYGLDDTAA